jgi:hypothetical protein
MKNLLFILIICLFSAAAIAQQSVTDVIYLKNGTVVRGKIIDQVPNQSVKLYTANRSVVEFKMEEIERMAKEENNTMAVISTPDEYPITQGNMIIGGSAGFSFYRETPDGGSVYKNTNINLSPYLGYFIADNLSVGAGINFNLNKSSGSTGYSFGLGPDVRYYFDMGLLLKTQISYSFYHYASGSKDNTFYIKPGVGYTIFLNSKVALEPCLVYEFGFGKYHSSMSDFKYKTGQFGLEIGLTIFL